MSVLNAPATAKRSEEALKCIQERENLGFVQWFWQGKLKTHVRQSEMALCNGSYGIYISVLATERVAACVGLVQDNEKACLG